eukprot:scaffold153929_cov31-Tisochrysis_lutea.AAC.2
MRALWIDAHNSSTVLGGAARMGRIERGMAIKILPAGDPFRASSVEQPVATASCQSTHAYTPLSHHTGSQDSPCLVLIEALDRTHAMPYENARTP